MNRFLPYLKYLRGHRTYLVFALLCGAISGLVFGRGLPVVINDVFPRIFTAGARSLPTLQVVGYAMLIPAVFFIRAVCGFLNNYLMSRCGIGVLESLRVELYAKLQHLPLSYFGRNRTGDLLSRLTADTLVVQQTITSSASDLVIQPLTLVGAISFLATIALQHEGVLIFLGSLAIIPVCVLPVRYVGKQLLKRADENQRLLGDISDLASQNLIAAREVRAFGLEAKEVDLFRATTRRLFHVQMKVVKYSQVLSPTIEVIASLGIAFSLYYAYRTGITLAVFTSILTALFACYEPVKKLGALHGQFTRGAASLNRIEEILHEPVAITDPAQPVAVPGRLRGDLAFEGVDFAYVPGEPVLRGIRVALPAGTVCALVGPSGAGKTTFANLVPRFYEVTAGRVTVDGHDVRSLRLADLRRNIAVVSQDPVLFNDTIYQNLLLGRAGATREEVLAAAVDAHADDFIRTLPNGYETVVGERGSLLSGGQKQRVALARAFLRNAPILILDEATSALDSQSEQLIQEALRKLVVGKTVLIIAHRFSTIRDASRILVFDRGQIVATGNPAELYASNPLYKGLYDRQAG
ncbi:MAG: ABC transporter ATP-binding protein [Verrucomicrobia bacterium]|nr:ABC transporter ATP-binding protein [Verrucomicrobiota bacterium]